MYQTDSNKIELDTEPLSHQINPVVASRFVKLLNEKIGLSQETLKGYTNKLSKLLILSEVELALITLVADTLSWNEFSGSLDLLRYRSEAL